jgi:hypothetical protein
MSPSGVVATANHNAPMTAMPLQTSMHAFGPKRSRQAPSGTCAAANATKNALDNSPISAADRASSAARLGAITPIELRSACETM